MGESITQTSVNYQQRLTTMVGAPAGMSYFYSRYSMRTVHIDTPELFEELSNRGYETSEMLVDSTTLEFGPGRLGLDVDNDGTVRYVNSCGQGAELGVQGGWILTHINSQPYSHDMLEGAMQKATHTGTSNLLTFRTHFSQIQYVAKIPVDAGDYCKRSLYDVP